MAAQHEIVIVGGGHNGLVAAFYLARAAFRPLLLERRSVTGGAAATEEFYPGFKCSTLAHAAGPLLPRVAKDLELKRHGLHWIEPQICLFAPEPGGRSLVFGREAAGPPGRAGTAAAIERFSKHDAEKYREFQTLLARYGKFLSQLHALTPPSIDRPLADGAWSLLQLGRSFRQLGKKDMRRLLRWIPMAVADLVAEFFETELLRAAVAARGIFGAALGPRSPGSAAGLLWRAAADPNPVGVLRTPRGGMGALAQALAEAAKSAGVVIRTDAEVVQIEVKDGAVAAVVLRSGEEIPAKVVVSNADPRRTFLKLMDPVHLEPGFLRKMQHYRCPGTVAKVNLALDSLPSFTALRGSSPAAGLSEEGPNGALAGRIHIGPEIDYLERAFDDWKYGDFSRAPVLDITLPSLADPTLAPPGKQVMSIIAQFVPYRLKQGDWTTRRDALADTVIRTIAAYAPDLEDRILARQVITPRDLEDAYALTGGHIFHGELSLDQLFTMRPLLGWARYRTPIRRLYLCGSGTHPGSGLTGASGFNAAREILKDLRR